ncbi:DEAD-box ATP-dependent RNA helicase 13-like [Camellia sinensis]|uniref:DEAD-box ATP-dependent RNA helicase 13-like n=1 Tax=Camellia sinensis TaxID=4442 RepID=UPI001036CD06|nr:DEAD-box ATP-dependent RNA helicase 13-like [Camellia sinensis]
MAERRRKRLTHAKNTSTLQPGFLSLEEIDESEYGLEIPKPERENKKQRTKENKNEKKRKHSEVEDELGGEVEAVSEEKDNKVKRKKKKKKKKKKNKDAKNSEENEEPTAEVSDPKEDIEGDSVDEAEYYAWNELRLLPLLMKAIYSLGFKEPTPIQKACIPAAAHQGKVDFISIMLCLDHCFGKQYIVLGSKNQHQYRKLVFLQLLIKERLISFL